MAGDWDAAACALSVVLFLLHADGQEDAEAVASPQLGAKKLLKCLKALRQRPVIPLMAGIPLCLMTLLQASPALVALGQPPLLPAEKSAPGLARPHAEQTDHSRKHWMWYSCP